MSLPLLAIVMVLAGLAMVWLSGNAKYPLLVLLVFWAGIALVVIGLVLLLTPVVVWFNMQLRAALNV